MSHLDDLCAVCESIDPVNTLRSWETNSIPMFNEETCIIGVFILGDGNCPFCRFCVQALDSIRIATGRPPLDGQFQVTVAVERRWGYDAIMTSGDVNWLKLSVNEDAASSPRDGRTEEASSDSVRVQIIRFANGFISDEQSYLYGRLVNNDVNMDLIKFWMSQCIGIHDGCESKPVDSDLPEYLIDTATLMLVPKFGRCQYAALSYVWGSPQTRQFTLRDLQRLAPGRDSWSIGRHWTDVPQTIKDAILLCQLLSIRFLWVDSLCIQHERPAQSQLCDTHLAQQMCSIYTSAHITIVAAAGRDSWAGLPGLRAGTRSVKQHTLRLHDTLLATVQKSPRDVMASSTWSTRAWTLQESVLSNRLLIFTDEHCFWSCNTMDSTFCEDIHREVNQDVHTSYSNDPLYFDIRETKQCLLGYTEQNRHENYQTYVDIIADYSSRSLTYQQDALEAFGGAAHFLSKEISTTFLWGVPLRFFEQALLFHPHSQFQGTLIRRRQFPSWSWVGWCLTGSEGRGVWCDSWVGTRRNSTWFLDDFRSVHTWYRFERIIGKGLGEFRALEGIENPLDGSGGPSCRTYAIPSSILQPSHALLFDSTTVCLELRKDTQDADPEAHSISVYIPGKDRIVATLMLDQGGNQTHSHELVAVAQETREVEVYTSTDPRPTVLKEVIHAILIETDVEGVSERKQIFTLDKTDWDEAKPKQRTIFLV